jgi:hypothetical protein
MNYIAVTLKDTVCEPDGAFSFWKRWELKIRMEICQEGLIAMPEPQQYKNMS